jgi:hypothetical protein
LRLWSRSSGQRVWFRRRIKIVEGFVIDVEAVELDPESDE